MECAITSAAICNSQHAPLNHLPSLSTDAGNRVRSEVISCTWIASLSSETCSPSLRDLRHTPAISIILHCSSVNLYETVSKFGQVVTTLNIRCRAGADSSFTCSMMVYEAQSDGEGAAIPASRMSYRDTLSLANRGATVCRISAALYEDSICNIESMSHSEPLIVGYESSCSSLELTVLWRKALHSFNTRFRRVTVEQDLIATEMLAFPSKS